MRVRNILVYPPMCPGFDSRTRRHMWVEFVVGSLLCSERFFSGHSGFPLSFKTNISKFQFDSGMHGHFLTSSCERLAAPWLNKLHLHSLHLLHGRVKKWDSRWPHGWCARLWIKRYMFEPNWVHTVRIILFRSARQFIIESSILL